MAGAGGQDNRRITVDPNRHDNRYTLAVRNRAGKPILRPARGLFCQSDSTNGTELTIGGDTTQRAGCFNDGDTIGVACDPNDNSLQFYINDKRVWIMAEQPVSGRHFADGSVKQTRLTPPPTVEVGNPPTDSPLLCVCDRLRSKTPCRIG